MFLHKQHWIILSLLMLTNNKEKKSINVLQTDFIMKSYIMIKLYLEILKSKVNPIHLANHFKKFYFLNLSGNIIKFVYCKRKKKRKEKGILDFLKSYLFFSSREFTFSLKSNFDFAVLTYFLF